MVRKDLIDSISNSASLFIMQIKNKTAIGDYGINVHAENAYMPILNIVFNIKLVNANSFTKNHVSVDLVDTKNKIAFQISSNSKQDRITETLEKFINHELYLQYDTLYFFILTEKKTNYNVSKINNIIQDKIKFDANKHIIDAHDIVRLINFIDSLDTLGMLARMYESLVKSHQNRTLFVIGKPLSFLEETKEELIKDLGLSNIDQLPDLPELFHEISVLDDLISVKEQELERCQNALNTYSGEEESLIEILTKAYNDTKEKNENLKEIRSYKKMLVNNFIQKIKRQKEFLEQMDRNQISERMKEIKTLFESGKWKQLNDFINSEDRDEDIKRKIEEREKQSQEFIQLADEEAFLALSIFQKEDWEKKIEEIEMRFERSIKLGGYNYNAYLYAYFLAKTKKTEDAIGMLIRTKNNLPDDDLVNRALIIEGLVQLVDDKSVLLSLYKETLEVNEILFEQDPNNYILKLVEVLYNLGQLLFYDSIVEAREFLERALLLLGSVERGNRRSMQLTFLVLIILGNLHLEHGDIEQTNSYNILALEIGGMLAIHQPDKDVNYLHEVVDRFRIFLREEKDGVTSELLYKRGLSYFLEFHPDLSLEENYYNAKSLSKLGAELLAAKEVKGSYLCFKNALKIFRILNKKKYSCVEDISYAYSQIEFIKKRGGYAL